MISRIYLLLTAFLVLGSVSGYAKNNVRVPQNKLYFIENKGQLTDQYNKVRKDVQFVVPAPGMNVFVGDGQVHYQFSRNETNFRSRVENSRYLVSAAEDMSCAQAATYRMDVDLLNAEKHVQVVAEEEQSYYETYYTAGTPDNGLVAHTYHKVTYKEVYPGIDWVIKTNGNNLEYEFIVGPNGDASNIKLQYSGQTSLNLSADGSITAVTPMGIIKEHAPVCYLSGKGVTGGLLPSSFSLKGNTLSFDIANKSSVLIDPVVEWGTYYGPDSSTNEFYAITTDDSAHIYAVGLTWGGNAGTISTTGSYQNTLGGSTDAFLVKLDSSGNRIWATYYGGTDEDWGTGVAFDHAGGVYIDGNTASTDHMASPGCAQPAFAGGLWDGFIAKFTTGGFRVWGTYCGGSGANTPGSIVCDRVGNVYMGGVTDDGNNIATTGSFQSTAPGGYNCFLESYNATTGARNWGTYYGGSGDEYGGTIGCDGYNIYIMGTTTSTTGLGTVGTHQVALAGTIDDFVAKFNGSGTRLWGTYIGGSAYENLGDITCDVLGDVYLFACTSSDTGIATPGAWQPVRAGLTDAFLAKIDPELGQIVWSTYYGGPNMENTDNSRISTDSMGNVYVTGYTTSTSGISSATAPQPDYGGDPEDGFIAKYSTTGKQKWSTYCGGEGQDVGMSTATDGFGIYIAGYTNSATGIATTGSYLNHGGGAEFYSQSFLVKYHEPFDSATLGVTNMQQSLDQVIVFPIPANGYITLSGAIGAYNGNIAVSINDIAGRTIQQRDVNVYNGMLREQFNISDIPAGVYFVKISADNVFKVLKFVKE